MGLNGGTMYHITEGVSWQIIPSVLSSPHHPITLKELVQWTLDSDKVNTF